MKHTALLAIGLSAFIHSACWSQTAWSLTKLSAPLGATMYDYVPTTLDETGAVQGGLDYKARNFFAIEIYNPGSSPNWQYKQISWGSSTASSTSAVSGTKYFFPLLRNAQGNTVGRYNTDYQPYTQFVPSMFGYGLDSIPGQVVIRRGTSNQAAPSTRFYPKAMNARDEVAGWEYLNSAPEGYSPRSRAVVWRGQLLVELPAAGFVSSRATAMNASGMVGGSVVREETNTSGDGGPASYFISYPAIWLNDQLVWHGAQASNTLPMRNANVVAVNANGQALINSPTQGAGLWQNGQTQWLPLPANVSADRKTWGTVLNDEGTVAGCLLRPSASLSRQDVSFFWRQGTSKALNDEILAKGLKLPTNQKVYCPVAMNNKGAMLLLMAEDVSNGSNPVQFTSANWVRLTPKY